MTCDAGSRSAGHVVSNDFSDWLTSLVSAESGLQSRKRERVGGSSGSERGSSSQQEKNQEESSEASLDSDF